MECFLLPSYLDGFYSVDSLYPGLHCRMVREPSVDMSQANAQDKTLTGNPLLVPCVFVYRGYVRT